MREFPPTVLFVKLLPTLCKSILKILEATMSEMPWLTKTKDEYYYITESRGMFYVVIDNYTP